jgi:hypothetical protein
VLRLVVVRVGNVAVHGSISGSGVPRVSTEFELGGTVLTLICGSAGTDLDNILRFTVRTRDLFFEGTIAHSYHRASLLFVARVRVVGVGQWRLTAAGVERCPTPQAPILTLSEQLVLNGLGFAGGTDNR